MTIQITCVLRLTSRARFRKWLFKWAFDIISTRSSYSTIFSFSSRNICCLPNINASCFCIDLQQSIYKMFIKSTGFALCSHFVQSLCAVALCSRFVQSLCAVALCSHFVQSLCAVTLCSHFVQSVRTRPICFFF